MWVMGKKWSKKPGRDIEKNCREVIINFLSGFAGG